MEIDIGKDLKILVILFQKLNQFKKRNDVR